MDLQVTAACSVLNKIVIPPLLRLWDIMERGGGGKNFRPIVQGECSLLRTTESLHQWTQSGMVTCTRTTQGWSL